MTISARTRFEILKRDGFQCRYCGATAVGAVLHVDHVIAIANGGSDDPTNVLDACNGVLWADDALVTRLELVRAVDVERPRTVVLVTEMLPAAADVLAESLELRVTQEAA